MGLPDIDGSIMIPSTIYSGACERPLALMLVAPRNCTEAAYPGSPDAFTTFTPADLPRTIDSTVVAGACSNISESILSIENVVLVFVSAPATPVTITASIFKTSSCKPKFWVPDAITVTVACRNPI